VTLEVSMLSRWTAATLFLADITELKGQLSVDFCSEEMRAATGGRREPYREVLKGLESRLQATLLWTESYLKDTQGVERTVLRGTGGEEVRGVEPLRSSDELAAPLLMMHRSLVETGLSSIAGGMLTDTIRRVAAFGLSLLPLDLRQESARHSEALNAITQHLGIGSYLDWDEDRRRLWLLQELKSRRPLLPRNFSYASFPALFTPTVTDTLRTFEVAAALQEGSLGAYVISQCQQASDILAVMLLQQDAGVSPRLRVVPLFETLDDLQRAEATVKALFEVAF
jgi:phosphoenolpyruvate carboxylase